MSQKKEEIKTEQKVETEEKELDLEQLKDVTGGSLRNVSYTKTQDISQDTRNKI